MHPVLRSVLAVVAGYIGGSVVNIALIMAGTGIIPAPDGVDVMNADSIRENLHLFTPVNFLFPFLAHALGTLAGAVIAYVISIQHKQIVAWVIGICFLLGGIYATTIIPAPAWFIVADLLLAYIPMAFLAILIGKQLQKS